MTKDITEADIDAMKTREVYRLLDDFGVDGEDLEPTEAKTALKEKIKQMKEEAEKATSPEQVAEKMADIAESYKAKRELLLKRCKDVTDYLPNLDPSEREKLALHFKRDVMDILSEVEDHLSKDDCPILVAGETSAGKSTLLNLLLGDDILPVAHMSSTSTICEVKYGETRQALVHLREPDAATGSQMITVPLSEDPEECRRQLTRHIHLKGTERETLPPAAKIEIFWPIAFLKGGVTIVDSPGVGESEMMDDIIAKYIPSAFAFIYIIDSSRAGGVQQDREAVKGGIRSADFNKLLDGIYELLPGSLNRKLSTQYRRMVAILEEALKYVRLKLNDAFGHLEEGEKRKAYAEAQSALSYFDESVDPILQELRKFLETATEEAADVFSDFLRGEEVRKHLSTVPIKATTEDNAIAELSLAIEIYMMKNCQPFKDKVRVANAQFRAKLESMVARVNHEHNEKIRPVTGRRHQLNVEDVVGNRQTNAWFEWLNQTVRRLNGPYLSIMSAFKGDCEHTERSRLSEMAIAAMATEGEVFAIARNNLLKSFQLLGAFESDLQGVKEVEERLVEERFSETRNQIDLVSKYEPQASGITLQLGRLAMVDLSEMREYEFDLDNIIGWQDPQNKIGGGSYGEVYRVDVQRDSARVRAALKIGVLPYALTTKDNAWNFLAEEDNLRKLRGEHIVEYYGTACRREGGGLRLGLVMELCEGTLEDRVVGQREHNPTWWEHDPVRKREAFRYIQDKSVQLCEGLRTIHDAGYIHRDLKLINVLVTAGDIVKLADVGVTKREVDVTGTVTGTAIYAAPEVKNRQLYDKSADIYSLGLLLWEMWYGRTVWNAMEDPSLKSLTEGESMMMPQSPDSVRPIPEWATLVRECQHKNANRRPSALECLQRIRDMTTEVGPQRSISFQTTV
ncbi:uncharacterized protein LOC144919115 isoform X2 [Branchiostoma floridae x Branchiostoma belcheri]